MPGPGVSSGFHNGLRPLFFMVEFYDLSLPNMFTLFWYILASGVTSSLLMKTLTGVEMRQALEFDLIFSSGLILLD